MDKNTIIKIAGVAGIVLGATALFIAGVGQTAAIDVVGAVFVLAGLVAAIFDLTKPKISVAAKIVDEKTPSTKVDTPPTKKEPAKKTANKKAPVCK